MKRQSVLPVISWHHVTGFLHIKILKCLAVSDPETPKLATCSFKPENQKENKQMVLLDLNNKVSVVYHGSPYVWNSTHNSASVLDPGSEWTKRKKVCVVPVRVKEDCEELSLFLSRLSPRPSLSDCLSSPHWLFETIGSSCEVVKPSGTSLKRQIAPRMASISLSHANKAS